MQKEWKKIGNTGPRNENKLWKAFRKPCDDFFKAKESFEEVLEKQKIENISHYEALIKSIKEYNSSDDLNKDLDELKQFSIQYKQLGELPKNKQTEIYKSFKSNLSKQYENLNIDPDKKEIIFWPDIPSF